MLVHRKISTLAPICTAKAKKEKKRADSVSGRSPPAAHVSQEWGWPLADLADVNEQKPVRLSPFCRNFGKTHSNEPRGGLGVTILLIACYWVDGHDCCSFTTFFTARLELILGEWGKSVTPISHSSFLRWICVSLRWAVSAFQRHGEWPRSTLTWKQLPRSGFAALTVKPGWLKKDRNVALLCVCSVYSTRYVCQAMRMQWHELWNGLISSLDMLRGSLCGVGGGRLVCVCKGVGGVINLKSIAPQTAPATFCVCVC